MPKDVGTVVLLRARTRGAPAMIRFKRRVPLAELRSGWASRYGARRKRFRTSAIRRRRLYHDIAAFIGPTALDAPTRVTYYLDRRVRFPRSRRARNHLPLNRGTA